MNNKTTSHWPITLTNGFAAVLNVFLPISLVRILTPDQVGRYKIFFLYVLLSPGIFMTAGLTNGLYHWMGHYPKTKPEVRQSWTLCLAIALLSCGLGMLFVSPLARLVGITVADARVFISAAPFALAAGFFEDMIIARGDIWAGSFYSSGFSLLRTSSILAAAWWTHDVMSTFWAYLAVNLLRLIVGWRYLSASGDVAPLFSLEKSKPVLSYAFPVSFSALASMALANIDQMVLSVRLSSAEFAFYSMGCLTLPPLDILENSVNRILIPRMARAFSEKDNERVAALFADAVSELWRYLLPATVGLVLFAKPIVIILFTQRYVAAARYLRFYPLYYLMTSFPYNSVARARADAKWILKTTFVSAPLGVLLTMLATTRFGAMGALGSMLATTAGLRVWALIYNRRILDLPYSSFFPGKDLARQTAAALAATAAGLALRPFFHDARLWFLVGGPVFTLVYFGLTYALFLRRLGVSTERPHVLQLAVRHGHNDAFENGIQSLSESLVNEDHFQVTVAGFNEGHGDASTFGRSDLPLVTWRKKAGFSAPVVLRILRLVFSERLTAVHTHDLGPLIYGALVKILTLGHVRLIMTVADPKDLEQAFWRKALFKLFLPFSDNVIAGTATARAALMRLGVDPIRITVASKETAYAEIFSGGRVHG